MNRRGNYEYDSFLADCYDYLPPYAARADLDFYVSSSRAAKGKTLELGCGTGRILIPTAAAGCQIWGLERSPHMLAKCREKLNHQPPEVQARVRLVQGDMVDFDLGETFGLLTAPFRSFQHLLSVEEQLRCLGSAHHHLLPGGRLILDVFQVDLRFMKVSEEEREDFPETELPDGRRLRRTFRTTAVHWAEQYNHIELIYYVAHVDGRRQRVVQALPLRYFFRYELEHLLARGGFRVLERFGNYDRSPLRDDSPEMIFVAEKAA